MDLGSILARLMSSFRQATFNIISVGKNNLWRSQWPSGFANRVLVSATNCWFESASVPMGSFHSWCKKKQPHWFKNWGQLPRGDGLKSSRPFSHLSTHCTAVKGTKKSFALGNVCNQNSCPNCPFSRGDLVTDTKVHFSPDGLSTVFQIPTI